MPGILGFSTEQGTDDLVVERVLAKAEAAGLESVMDRCMKIEHARILGGLNWAGVNTRVISAKRPKVIAN